MRPRGPAAHHHRHTAETTAATATSTLPAVSWDTSPTWPANTIASVQIATTDPHTATVRSRCTSLRSSSGVRATTVTEYPRHDEGRVAAAARPSLVVGAYGPPWTGA